MDTVQFADGNSLVYFSNTGPDPVENLKATHVPSQHYMTAHHWSASETPFNMMFR